MNTKWTFNRSISKDMLKAINKEYSRGDMGWINQYIDDDDLFLAIRDGYINFYYRGNSILKLNYKNGILSGDIHYKYLLRPFLKKEKNDQPYVNLSQEITLPVIAPTKENAAKWIKAASKPYSGVEKEGLAKILKANENIVDVEVSFQRETEDGEIDGKKQDRIDFCALRENKEGVIELCFYEAKHFSNKELRAQGEPAVVKQISRYKETLSSHEEEVRIAYQQAFENILELNYSHPAEKHIKKALKEGFSISEDIRLVIFGFDGNQKEGFLRSIENNLIKHGLKKEFILTKGDSKGFCVGISK